MKKRKILPWRRLAELERRVEALEARLSREEAAPLAPYVEDAGVPMAQVIREYLWGEEHSGAVQ